MHELIRLRGQRGAGSGDGAALTYANQEVDISKLFRFVMRVCARVSVKQKSKRVNHIKVVWTQPQQGSTLEGSVAIFK